MASIRRPRACDACHSLKIKCELGTTGGPGPCMRCTRLGKECQVTPPKSQRDRVAELEAQVASLTRLLESQAIGSQSTNAGADLEPNPPVANDTSQKKRKLDIDPGPAEPSPCPDLREIDRIVSTDVQRRLFRKYVDETVPLIPLVPLAEGMTFDRFRERQPLLFQTVIYAVSSGTLGESDQDSLGAIVLRDLDAICDMKGPKSSELVQALQVAALWYRAPKNHRHVAAFHLAQRAADIADKMSLWDVKSQHTLGFTTPEVLGDPSTALRTWLVCHLLSANISVLLRQPGFKNIGELDGFSLHMLGYLECRLATDRALCQVVRAEQLCERIVTDLKLSEASICDDVSDPEVHVKMKAYQRSITDWKAQANSMKLSPFLTVYESVVTLLIHETVLHTATNKPSFAAPYLAERLSITDFPAPLVTPDHVTSIYALRTAAHDVLELYGSVDIKTWMSLSFFLCVARVAYAEYILVKLYIATTANGNTFGAFLDPDSLEVDKYLDQVISIATAVQKIDSSCPAGRILLAPVHLKEWLSAYRAGQTDNAFIGPDYRSTGVTAPLENGASPLAGDLVDWTSLASDYSGLEFELDPLLTEPPSQALLTEPVFMDEIAFSQTNTKA